MKVLSIRRYFLWAVIAVLVLITIYRLKIGFPVPGFNEEAVKKLMAK